MYLYKNVTVNIWRTVKINKFSYKNFLPFQKIPLTESVVTP